MLDDLEEVEFNEFYNKLEQFLQKSGEEETPVFGPDSRLKARDWVFAYVKLSEEIEIYKKEYIPMLIEKYIEPVKEKIKKHEAAQDFIKTGLFEFLTNAGEKSAAFPDLATIGKAKIQPKLVYPEDEKALIESLEAEGSKWVVKKSALDKKSMLDYFKQTGEVPVNGVIGEAESEGIRVTVAKNRKQNGEEA